MADRSKCDRCFPNEPKVNSSAFGSEKWILQDGFPAQRVSVAAFERFLEHRGQSPAAFASDGVFDFLIQFLEHLSPAGNL